MSRTKKAARRHGNKSNKRPNEQQTDVNNKPKARSVEANGTANKRQKTEQPAPTKATGSNAEAMLSRLLGGMPLTQFLEEYFEKKPLIVRRSESQTLFPSKLFGRTQLLDALSDQSLAFGQDLTVCRYVDGVRDNYTPPENKGMVAKRKTVDGLLTKGYSCQFYQPQRYVDGLCDINRAFESHFGCLAGSSAYLTPPSAQALAPHHDDVEVFVLQTEGSKDWKLYHPLTELAGEHSKDLSPNQIGEPWMEFTLHEGDMLYFPRGVIHQASTAKGAFSTHVTISVYQHQSWANFLEVALPRIIRRAFDSDVAFRRGLPIQYLRFMGTECDKSFTNEAAAFKTTIQQLVKKMGDYVDTKDLNVATDEAAMDFMANRLPPSGSQAETDENTQVSPFEPDARMRLKHKQFVRLISGVDEENEAFVALYDSTRNCRRHHMGLCDCYMNEDDEGEGSGSDYGEEDQDQEEREEHDLANAMLPGPPPQAKSVVFPIELLKPLKKLLITSDDEGVSCADLVSDDIDETSVRGVVLRLWSEGLLEMVD